MNECEMIAKELRIHGVKAFYNDEHMFGIIKPHTPMYSSSKYGDSGFGRLVTFTVKDGIIICSDKDRIYNLHEPRSLGQLIKSIKLCEQRTSCHQKCEFKSRNM